MTKKNIFLGLALLMLMACSKNSIYSYSYLMQHPFELKKEFDRCQSLLNRSENSQCDVVEKAAKDIYVILDEQQTDPEKFGQDILDAQIECAKMKVKVKKAEQSLADLQTKKASPNAIKLAQYELETAQQNAENAKEKVKILLAVASLNSPE